MSITKAQGEEWPEAWEQLSRLIFRIQGHREEELQNKWEMAFHPQQREALESEVELGT